MAARPAKEKAAEAARRELDARTVDRVVAGSEQDERAHAIEETRSDSGWLEGRRYRSARGGGSFSYALKVPPSAPAVLRVAYWGGESRRHRFEVLVEARSSRHSRCSTTGPGRSSRWSTPSPSGC